MEDDAIMLPSGCALACVSLVFGIKGEFHQNLTCIFILKAFPTPMTKMFFLTSHVRFESWDWQIGGNTIINCWNYLPHLYQERNQIILVFRKHKRDSHFLDSWGCCCRIVFFILRAQKSVFVIKASRFWWNDPLMWSRRLFLLPESHPHAPAETPTRTPPPRL